MKIPTDYTEGYREALAIDPARAGNYVLHTTIGDPEADEMMEELSGLPQSQTMEYFRAGMEADHSSRLADAPEVVRKFFRSIAQEPDWVDHEALMPGVRMFHRNSKLVLGGMVGGTLIEGFSTNIAKSFFITGRLRDQGVRRLQQNNRHMVEIFMPGGLDRHGDGWKLSVRIRLVHAQVRRLLNASGDWDTEAWGTPLSAAHVGFAITAFSARLLKHLKSLGAKFNEVEREGFMNVWRYSGYLMGIPESILYEDEADALELFKIGVMCEPEPGFESVAMANSLVNSAPLVIGITDPAARQQLVKYVYGVSRALIGKPMAKSLGYPDGMTFGTLPLFRIQVKYERLLNRLMPKHSSQTNFNNFTGLLEASVFDEAGISYRLPDHVYAEESRKW